MEAWIGFTTFPSQEIAREIATKLVEEQLCACVNLLPKAESIYRWEGKLETSEEIVGIVKFSAAQEKSLRDRLLALHPYEVAEWIAWPAGVGSPAYLNWIHASTLPA